MREGGASRNPLPLGLFREGRMSMKLRHQNFELSY
jgi:hypothetical protein